MQPNEILDEASYRVLFDDRPDQVITGSILKCLFRENWTNINSWEMVDVK